MTGIYARFMDGWERKLATRDTNRMVRPFEWGTDWLSRIGYPSCPAEANGQSAACLDQFVSGALADSDRFFAYQTPSDFTLRGSELTFSSAVRSGYPENDTAR